MAQSMSQAPQGTHSFVYILVFLERDLRRKLPGVLLEQVFDDIFSVSHTTSLTGFTQIS